MAQFSRDEVLKRAKIKQSLARTDLSGLDLSNAPLEGVDLSRAILDGTNLQGAKLRGANLKNASLRDASLKGADLSQSNCERADFGDAKLEGAKLDGANLKRATLEGTRLGGASLLSTCLTGAELTGAGFAGANLKQADLSHANLEQANLSGSDLGQADLRHANLTGSDLTNADVGGARLGKAVLVEVKASGVRGEVIDVSEQGDGSSEVRGAKIASLLGGKAEASGAGARYFGRGDVLRDAVLEFEPNSSVHIDSRFENCLLNLGDGVELTVGDSGVLKDCEIRGHGNITIHGRFFERRAPGIVGPKSLIVSSRGAMVGAVQQSPETTMFAFQPGCRLRVKILRPAAAQSEPVAAE